MRRRPLCTNLACQLKFQLLQLNLVSSGEVAQMGLTEFDKMKCHAAIGADILSSIDFPYPVVPIVRHHHEHWDGAGYPARLRGEAIPIGARILSVVDCFDALTSDRPQRVAYSHEEALSMLKERTPSEYDPIVVEALTSVAAQRIGSVVPLPLRKNG